MAITLRSEHIHFFGGLEELSLLHISDIHLWYSVKILGELEAIISRENADLIILTGDYYDLPTGAYNFSDFLCRISQKHTVLFIYGNHDKIYGKKIMSLLLNIPNCHCVEESVFVYESKNGHRYNITSWENRAFLPAKSCAMNILLIHNPEKIIEAELHAVDLVLAGHLHGGQFIFFKTSNNSNFPGSFVYKHCADRKQISNATLIVSRGLGDTFPFRFNCPKEVIRILIN
jgi:predicted MPP superfamily phosphohydrolase